MGHLGVVTGRVRRLMGAGAVAALLLTFASPAEAKDMNVSGTHTFEGTFAPSDSVCDPQTVNGVDLVAGGSGDWAPLGAVTFTMAICPVLDPAHFGPVPWSTYLVADGRFTATTSKGELTGEFVEGWSGNPEHMVFEIVSGSGELEGATGSLTFDNTGHFVWSGSGQVAGTVVLPERRPTSRGDCLHGGWRDLVDDEGHAFPNQGLCVAWISRA